MSLVCLMKKVVSPCLLLSACFSCLFFLFGLLVKQPDLLFLTELCNFLCSLGGAEVLAIECPSKAHSSLSFVFFEPEITHTPSVIHKTPRS